MLIHHDSSKSYREAASAAAANARSKLDALISDGRLRARKVFDTVQAEQPVDRLIRGGALRFVSTGDVDPASNDILVRAGRGEDRLQRLHPHALQQAGARVGLPWSYTQHLREQQGWGPELVAHNLNALFHRASQNSDDRFLLRSVKGEIRGFLSNRYRRLDSRPLVDSFAKACGELGALPVEGYVTDVRIAIKAVLPTIFEPVANEVMCFGALLENSDFGAGALSVRVFCLRLVCTNFAIADEGIREVHLGARLPDDIDWSERTHSLDTRRMASAVGDVVRGQLSSTRIDAFQDAIRAANEQHTDPRQALQLLRKNLTKAEADQAVEKYNSPDVQLLPPGNSIWRLSNAVSWLAGTMQDTDRKLELMKLAGRLLPKAA